MEIISITSLVIACVLALERMFKRVKKCRSGCCDIELQNAPSSPKNVSV